MFTIHPSQSRMFAHVPPKSVVAAAELSLDELISQADKALYRARLLGRNQVEICSGSRAVEVDLTDCMALQEAI